MEQTRQVFLGEASLATGFRMAGFEVYPDADVAQLERMLERLQAERSHAFVVIDHALADAGSRRLDEVRREGGRILVTQVPALTAPDDMHGSVDRYIQQLLGMDGNDT